MSILSVVRIQSRFYKSTLYSSTANPYHLGFLLFLFSFLFAPAGKAELVRTGYTTIVSTSTAQCLDIGSSLLGANAVQSPCNQTSQQKWTVQLVSSNSFHIVQQQTGSCLVFGETVLPGANLVLEPCSAATTQLWSFTPSGNSFQLVNTATSQCAGSLGVAPLTGIVQQPCALATNSLWNFTSGLITPSSATVAQAAHSGQCMNVAGSSLYVGAAVVQSPCAGAANEQWTFVPAGSFYNLVAGNSGLCASSNGIASSGASIVQTTCSSADASGLWSLKPVAGSYEVISNISNLCLNVSGASQVAATKIITSACTGALNQLWSLSPAELSASWSAVTPLAVDPIEAASLPDGNIVMWSANDQYTFEGDIGDRAGQTYTAIFNPSTLTSSQILVTNTGADMFCPGTANLFDGTVLVNGGNSSPRTSIYNPATGVWALDADMHIPRGYQADTVLTNGSVLTFGGSFTGGIGGKTAEVWTPGQGWRLLSAVPETGIIGPDPRGTYRGDNHLWMFSAPNGQVFQAGPSAPMHWITTSGNGTITPAGNRSDDPYAMNGNAVLYDVGMIMKTGGAPAYENVNAEASTYLININNGTAGVSVSKIAPMAYPRGFANAVVLPSGQVVVIGGETHPVTFSDNTAILVPEIWDPITQVFRQLTPMKTPRVYHSTALLLQDGRVYAGGGGQCGQGCSANHFNTEILTPPYLYDSTGALATQPVISSAPTSVALGSTLSVTTASPVVSFVLMRLSSVTHSVNNDQRRIPLAITSVSANQYSLEVPSNPGVVLPGNYWLFAMDAQGVPSVAAEMLITN